MNIRDTDVAEKFDGKKFLQEIADKLIIVQNKSQNFILRKVIKHWKLKLFVITGNGFIENRRKLVSGITLFKHI